MYPLREIGPLIFPEFVGMTAKEIDAAARVHSDKLKHQWLDSGQTDFSIYSDPSYLYESLISFYEVSRKCIGGVKHFVKTHNVDVKGKTYFELYNGLGINALELTELGFKVFIHNDAPGQVDAMMKLFKHFKLKPPTILGEEWRKQKFDYVAAYEVIEHFKEPVNIAKDLIGSIKKGGCLIESCGFNVTSYPGHFDEYIVDGNTVSSREASHAVVKLLHDSGYEQIYDGFNRKPRIWRDVGVGNNSLERVVRPYGERALKKYGSQPVDGKRPKKQKVA